MIMADSFNIATLFPDAAIRVSRPAEPFICVPMVEKVSDCVPRGQRLDYPDG